jgi:hypothetical protein
VPLKKYENDQDLKSRIVYNGVVMAGGNLILSNFNRRLLVISPLDGKIIQTIKTSEKIYHTPIIVDKKLYLHTIGRFSVDLVTIE